MQITPLKGKSDQSFAKASAKSILYITNTEQLETLRRDAHEKGTTAPHSHQQLLLCSAGFTLGSWLTPLSAETANRTPVQSGVRLMAQGYFYLCVCVCKPMKKQPRTVMEREVQEEDTEGAETPASTVFNSAAADSCSVNPLFPQDNIRIPACTMALTAPSIRPVCSACWTGQTRDGKLLFHQI